MISCKNTGVAIVKEVDEQGALKLDGKIFILDRDNAAKVADLMTKMDAINAQTTLLEAERNDLNNEMWNLVDAVAGINREEGHAHFAIEPRLYDENGTITIQDRHRNKGIRSLLERLCV